MDQENARVLIAPQVSEKPPSPRVFLAGAFWAVGVLCVYLYTAVFAAAHRFGPVELPLLGKCSTMEGVLFTLSFCWAPLALLHIILHTYISLPEVRQDPPPRFPGAVKDSQLPIRLRGVSAGLFIVLCMWPSFVHCFLTGRAFSHYAIVPKDVVGKSPLASEQWEAIRGSRLLGYAFSRPSSPTWQRGGATWWVNYERPEWCTTFDYSVRSVNSEGRPQLEGVPMHERVVVSALRMQPLFFVLSSCLLSISIIVAVWRACRSSTVTVVETQS